MRDAIRYILTICLMILQPIFPKEIFDFEGQIIADKKPLFVSLGSGCDTAITLRDCGLRNAALPFDWLVTGNHERFIQLLDDDFKYFIDERYFIPVEDASDHPNSLKNTHYDVVFYHEGLVPYDWHDEDKYKEQIDRMRAKYKRRIERFQQLRYYPGTVYFIRNFTSPAIQASWHPILAVELRCALQRYFPALDFTLVIVTYADVQGTEIKGIEGVREFKMHRPDWRSEYEKMYHELLSSDIYSER